MKNNLKLFISTLVQKIWFTNSYENKLPAKWLMIPVQNSNKAGADYRNK